MWKISVANFAGHGSRSSTGCPARPPVSVKPNVSRFGPSAPAWGSTSKIHTGKFDSVPPSMITAGGGSSISSNVHGLVWPAFACSTSSRSTSAPSSRSVPPRPVQRTWSRTSSTGSKKYGIDMLIRTALEIGNASGSIAVFDPGQPVARQVVGEHEQLRVGHVDGHDLEPAVGPVRRLHRRERLVVELVVEPLAEHLAVRHAVLAEQVRQAADDASTRRVVLELRERHLVEHRRDALHGVVALHREVGGHDRARARTGHVDPLLDRVLRVGGEPEQGTGDAEPLQPPPRNTPSASSTHATPATLTASVAAIQSPGELAERCVFSDVSPAPTVVRPSLRVVCRQTAR